MLERCQENWSSFFIDKKRHAEKLNFQADCDAGIAQLVERNLAKVDVAGSSPVSRSSFLDTAISERRHSQVVRQRSAKSPSPVQIRVSPPRD